MSNSAVALWLLITTPIFGYIRGYTIMTLWNWFVPVAIPGANHIGFWLAFGLGGLVTFLTFRMPDHDIEDYTHYFVKSVVWSTIFPLLAMGAGWIAHHYM